MARRHMKKDDRTLECGLPLTPKFARNLAADRLTVTCGACELQSRPQPVKPPVVETVVAAADWAGAEGDEGMGHDHHHEGGAEGHGHTHG